MHKIKQLTPLPLSGHFLGIYVELMDLVDPGYARDWRLAQARREAAGRRARWSEVDQEARRRADTTVLCDPYDAPLPEGWTKHTMTQQEAYNRYGSLYLNWLELHMQAQEYAACQVWNRRKRSATQGLRALFGRIAGSRHE